MKEPATKFLVPQFADLMKYVRKYGDNMFLKNNIAFCFLDFILVHHIISEQGISQKELAERVMFDKTLVSKTLLKLEKSGFVERLLSPKDKRYRKLFVTELGKKEFERALEHTREFNTEIERDISVEEFEVVQRVLQKLRKNVNDILLGQV